MVVMLAMAAAAAAAPAAPPKLAILTKVTSHRDGRFKSCRSNVIQAVDLVVGIKFNDSTVGIKSTVGSVDQCVDFDRSNVGSADQCVDFL